MKVARDGFALDVVFEIVKLVATLEEGFLVAGEDVVLRLSLEDVFVVAVLDAVFDVGFEEVAMGGSIHF